MKGWVIRQLVAERARTLFVCLAIAAALAVVFLLEGFQQGLYAQLRQVVLGRGGDLIVTQAGVANFIASRSKLRQLSRAEIEAVNGVREAHPLTLVPVIYERAGRKTPIFFVVYDSAGGPAQIIEGQAIDAPRQIVIDQSLADLQGLGTGDALVVADFEFRVAGITRGSAAMFTPFAFVTYDDLIDFYFESDLVGDIASLPLLSFLIVELEPGADAGAVRAAIKRSVPDVDVFPPEVLAANDVTLGKTLFGPVMAVLIGISYLICLLVIAIILFGAASARRRSLGVLKALGFPARALIGGMLLEAVILTALSIVPGLLAAQAAAWLVEQSEPLYLVRIAEPLPLLRTVFAAFAAAALGALTPAQFISRLDPAMVFRN